MPDENQSYQAYLDGIATNGTVPEDQVKPTEFRQLVDDAYIVRAKGKKSGNEYIALRVKLSNGYEKTIFFDYAEQFMVEAELDKLNK